MKETKKSNKGLLLDYLIYTGFSAVILISSLNKNYLAVTGWAVAFAWCYMSNRWQNLAGRALELIKDYDELVNELNSKLSTIYDRLKEIVDEHDDRA
jgi:SNF family Na+-dependent transporter